MQNALCAFALACALAGCASLDSATISQNDLDAARSAYDAAFLAPAAAYRSLALCAPGEASTLADPCANAVVVQKLQAADLKVEQAFDTLQTLVSQGGAQNLITQFQALTQTVAAAEGLLSSLGIN